MPVRPAKNKGVVESKAPALKDEFVEPPPGLLPSDTEDGHSSWEHEWLCLVCTFHNRAMSLSCELCQEMRPIDAQALAPSVPPDSAVAAPEALNSARSTHWFCKVCTYAENDNDRGVCEICSHPRQTTSAHPSRVDQTANVSPSQSAPVQSFASATAAVPPPMPSPLPLAAPPGLTRRTTSLPPPSENAAVPKPKMNSVPPPKLQSRHEKLLEGKHSDAPTDETACPLCCEDFSVQEKDFLPCSCSYKVCAWGKFSILAWNDLQIAAC